MNINPINEYRNRYYHDTIDLSDTIKMDKRTNSKKIYDIGIFQKCNCFIIKKKIKEENKNENELIDGEKNNKEIEQKNYDKLAKDIESSIVNIKINMEKDEMKKKELELQEKRRIEEEKKRIEEEIQKEKKIKMEQEQKRLQEIRQKQEEERLRKIQEEMINNSNIYDIPGTFKQKLIVLGNSFPKVKNEYEKMNQNKQIKDKINQITSLINEKINNISVYSHIKDYKNNENKKFGLNALINLFKEIEEDKSYDYYSYASLFLLSRLRDKLNTLGNAVKSSDYYIISQIILKINNPKLTKIFYQYISYICPYIIPIIYTEKDYQDKDILRIRNGYSKDATDEKDTVLRMTNCLYLFFTFIKNEHIRNENKLQDYLNDYLINLEKFKPEEINFLVANSFVCFIDVFGNDIKNKRKDLMNKINIIYPKVKKGLENEVNTIGSNNTTIYNINRYKVDYPLTKFINKIEKNEKTNYILDIEDMMK